MIAEQVIMEIQTQIIVLYALLDVVHVRWHLLCSVQIVQLLEDSNTTSKQLPVLLIVLLLSMEIQLMIFLNVKAVHLLA